MIQYMMVWGSNTNKQCEYNSGEEVEHSDHAGGEMHDIITYRVAHILNVPMMCKGEDRNTV